jgi:hypothetical protein
LFRSPLAQATRFQGAGSARSFYKMVGLGNTRQRADRPADAEPILNAAQQAPAWDGQLAHPQARLALQLGDPAKARTLMSQARHAGSVTYRNLCPSRGLQHHRFAEWRTSPC